MKGNDFEMNRKIKQILSLLLAAVIFVGVMPMSTVPASAATRLTSSQIKNYVESRVGQAYTKNACLAAVIFHILSLNKTKRDQKHRSKT